MKARKAISSRSSFTLVEMLSAIAALSLLMALIFSILSSTLKISDTTSKSADSETEAKEVLDRIGTDIAGMLIRPDVDQLYYVAPSGYSDKIFFYSQVNGYFSANVPSTNQSPVALVGYRISTNTVNTVVQPALQRLAQGLTWDVDPHNTTQPLQYLTFGARTNVINYPAANGGTIPSQWASVVGTLEGNYNDGTSSYYDTIGDQVFLLGICFQLPNGTFSQYPGYTNSSPVYPGSITNTAAIVVAIATLDFTSRKLVSNWSGLTNNTLLNIDAAKFTQNPPQLMDSQWNAALTNSTFAQNAGIPAAAAAQIKVYQRYYYLNVPKAQ